VLLSLFYLSFVPRFFYNTGMMGSSSFHRPQSEENMSEIASMVGDPTCGLDHNREPVNTRIPKTVNAFVERMAIFFTSV